MQFNYVDLSVVVTEEKYTFASNQTAIMGIYVANTSSEDIEVTIKLRGKYLIKDIPLPVGSSVSVLDAKLAVNAGNELTVSTDVGSADVIVSTVQNVFQ